MLLFSAVTVTLLEIYIVKHVGLIYFHHLFLMYYLALLLLSLWPNSKSIIND